MARLLALNFEYGEEMCSCLITFLTEDAEMELAVSNIFAEGFNILDKPIVLKSKNGKIIINKSLYNEVPIITAIEKALNHYLKRRFGTTLLAIH